MAVYYPIFGQPVIWYGFRPQGTVSVGGGPATGTTGFRHRYYLYQEGQPVRYGFAIDGSVATGSGPPTGNTGFRHTYYLYQEGQYVRYGFRERGTSGDIPTPPVSETNVSGGIHLYRVYRRRRRHDDDEETADERRARIFAQMSEHLDEIEIRPKPKRAERKAQNKAIRRIERIAEEAISEDRGFLPQYQEFSAALAALREAKNADRMLANELAMSVANRLLSDVVGRMERLRRHNEHAITVILLSE